MFLTLVMNWLAANPRLARALAAMAIAAVVAGWLYHAGVHRGEDQETRQALHKALVVREKYDEIDNSRRGGDAVLELLHRGAF